MANCQTCGAESQLYLCNPCIGDLQDQLTALHTGRTTTETLRHGRTASGGQWRIERDRRAPGLLQCLEESATGQTNFGNDTRRVKTDEAPIRFNTRATKLITDIRKLLQFAAICFEPVYTPINPNDTAGYALWLSEHVHDLALVDGIGQFQHRLKNHIDKIWRTIERPPAPKFCGQCDTMTDGKICGPALYAPRDAIEITCPTCKTTHNIEKLYNRTLNNADNKNFPREVLIGNQRTTNGEHYTTGIMGELDEFVPWRTFHSWTFEGHLRPRQYLRPNGRRGLNRHTEDDIAEYRLADVRKLRRQTRKAKTA